MILSVAAGLVSGIASGMGIGGGVILIPILTAFLGIDQKTAQGITLLYFIPTAVFALIVHIKNKNVDIKVALRLALTGVPGAAAGSFAVKYIQTELLGKIFAVFLLTLGIHQIFSGVQSFKKGANRKKHTAKTSDSP